MVVVDYVSLINFNALYDITISKQLFGKLICYIYYIFCFAVKPRDWNGFIFHSPAFRPLIVNLT